MLSGKVRAVMYDELSKAGKSHDEIQKIFMSHFEKHVSVVAMYKYGSAVGPNSLFDVTSWATWLAVGAQAGLEVPQYFYIGTLKFSELKNPPKGIIKKTYKLFKQYKNRRLCVRTDFAITEKAAKRIKSGNKYPGMRLGPTLQWNSFDVDDNIFTKGAYYPGGDVPLFMVDVVEGAWFEVRVSNSAYTSEADVKINEAVDQLISYIGDNNIHPSHPQYEERSGVDGFDEKKVNALLKFVKKPDGTIVFMGATSIYLDYSL